MFSQQQRHDHSIILPKHRRIVHDQVDELIEDLVERFPIDQRDYVRDHRVQV